MTEQHAVIRLQRTISAPPARVHRAWLEPELLKLWLAPGSMHLARVEVDAERIVWRWGFVGPSRTEGPVFDSLLTITLREAPGASTELTLVHERLDALRAAMPHVADGVEPGWASVLDKLAESIDQANMMNPESSGPPAGNGTPTLFVCHGDDGGPRIHPCRRVQEALRAAGIEYQKVIAGHGSPWPFLRKGSREDLRAATGATKLPALKLPRWDRHHPLPGHHLLGQRTKAVCRGEAKPVAFSSREAPGFAPSQAD
jgi:uncharacterized protein YndB with AHSA1/START domain